MSLRDRLLALLVALLWGLNFPATEIALWQFPPILMVSLRWALLAIPAILFVPRPQVKLRWLVGTGLGIGVLQFGFVYVGMAAGMPSGLAGLALQSSAPFTMLLAGIFLREKISARQVTGIGVAVLGLAAIVAYRAQVAALLPVILTLAGGLGWAIGNICSRQARAPKPLHLTMWMSVIPPVPMALLSLVLEGPRRIGSTFTTLTTWHAWTAVLALLYIVIFAGLIAYGIWNTLLARNPSSQVAPFSMLMPAFGVASAWIALGEGMSTVEIVAGVAVICGVLYASRPVKKAPTVTPVVDEGREVSVPGE
ncbi:EamA family transporter [Amycolatopsis pithecellobii]|uniref:EamA family transporter n=1 Tax=Amycolatopsis pithecellobii TaxID=664692 RepID=A0A6N7Z0U7_9PSEU|nr:EamA family transporter [Amycolatopsis pithecellobii]MTD54339.1 EamA family transporter [Amycolatopsis pithecellobii]